MRRRRAKERLQARAQRDGIHPLDAVSDAGVDPVVKHQVISLRSWPFPIFPLRAGGGAAPGHLEREVAVLVLGLQRSFRQLQIRWPLWVQRLPAWAIGCAGAYWTIETTLAMLSGGA